MSRRKAPLILDGSPFTQKYERLCRAAAEIPAAPAAALGRAFLAISSFSDISISNK